MKSLRHLLAALALLPAGLHAQGDSLKTDLVSYWPFDEVQGTKTPDLKNGYDLTLANLDSADLVAGVRGMAFRFNATRSTYLFRTHAGADDLPANKHASFTIAFWAKANFSGQADKRLFSEGSNANNDPLFTLGTPNTGTRAAVDVFIRQGGTPLIDHLKSTASPLDGVAWHHIAFVQSLQPDGTATRALYIDGVLDALAIPARPAGTVYNMNITSFGAVLRTSGAAWVNGDIDEAAIWKRPLTPAEIIDLRDNGMPNLAPPLEPLLVNSFSADFRVASEGDTTRLRWDVTKDATITITPNVGDVTGLSSFGVGSIDVPVTAPATYTLTLTRGAEAPVTAMVSVSPRAGVAAGWRWVEDFEGLNAGALGGQARWLPAAGVFDVATVGASQATRITGGGDLTAKDLRSLTLVEGSSATLFFRFCLSALEPELPVDIKLGLTEKTIRFQGDFASNIGTYVKLNRVANGPLTLQAVNGIGGALTDAAFSFEADRVYNVWIDVTNNPLGTTDTFSVHVAEDGASLRSTVFNNFSSDREPQEVPLLGFPQPNINFVFAVAATADQSSQAVAIDDFYLSTTGGFNASVPTRSLFGKQPPLPFRIVGFTDNRTTGMVTLEWNSRSGEFYSIWFSNDLATWMEVTDSIPANTTDPTTTLALPGTFTTPQTYFQVRQ